MHRWIRKYAPVWLCVGFLLGISRGYLALWTGDDPEPAYVFSVRADTLPPVDRLRLRRGIRLAGQDALLEILEDYL